LDYKIINQNSNLISIKFAGYAYVAGAAHGDNALFSYNFNLRNGKGINLTDLFKPNSDYLDLLSDYAIRELENRNLGDSNLVKTGASQKAENFKIFNIGKDGLLFTFDDYQLGGYDTGPQTVLIPYEYLKDSLSAY
jgi:hypothetical protein